MSSPGADNGQPQAAGQTAGQPAGQPAEQPSTEQSTSSSTKASTSSSSTKVSTPSPAQPSAQTSVATSAPPSGTSAKTNAPPKLVSASSHHLTDGAVGGIIAGVAIVIAVIAAVLTYLFMKRQEKARKRRDAYLSREKADDEKSRTFKPTGTTKGEDSGIDKHLPQSADDRTVASKTNALFDQIEMFVENFYSTRAHSKTSASDTNLAQFNTPDLPNNIAALLSQTSDAQLLIKHALSHFLFSQISSTATVRDSLLPADLALIPWSLQAGSQQAESPGLALLLYRWRTLSAYLRPDPSSDKSYLADRDQKIATSARSFDEAFAPWNSKKYPSAERIQGLTSIFESSAALGLFLFSQPAELQFYWPRKTELKKGGLALTPALCKSADQRGQKLSPAQVIAVSRTATL